MSNVSITRNPAIDLDRIYATLYGSPNTYVGDPAPIGGTLLRAYATPVYNANLTPDPSAFEIYDMGVLTGAVAVAAPARADLFTIQKGTFLTFKWTQDGVGGRVVTYNAVFKQGGAVAFATTLSTVTIDVFFWDGTNWRIWNRITGQAI